MPYLSSNSWHTTPSINSTVLTTPVGDDRNPSDIQVQHWQTPHTENPGLSGWVGARVMNPPEGEAMYTCLTSGVAFLLNISDYFWNNWIEYIKLYKTVTCLDTAGWQPSKGGESNTCHIKVCKFICFVKRKVKKNINYHYTPIEIAPHPPYLWM